MWPPSTGIAAAGIKGAVDESGPSAFGMFSCSKATNEMNYMAQKFARPRITPPMGTTPPDLLADPLG